MSLGDLIKIIIMTYDANVLNILTIQRTSVYLTVNFTAAEFEENVAHLEDGIGI